MTIETSVADLTGSTTKLVTAVLAQQLLVSNTISAFTATTERVNNGLNNVDNTQDANKPISNLAQAAINTRQEKLISGLNISTVNGFSLLDGKPLVIVRSATSLNKINYSDRSTLRTTISQVDDSTVVEGLGLFMFVDSFEEPDDDETCFTTSYGQWLLRLPSWDIIDAWNLIEKSFLDDLIEDEPLRFAKYLLNNK